MYGCRRPSGPGHRRRRSDLDHSGIELGEWSIRRKPVPNLQEETAKMESPQVPLSPPMIILETKYLEHRDPFAPNWDSDSDDEDNDVQHIEDVAEVSNKGKERADQSGLFGLGISAETAAFGGSPIEHREGRPDEAEVTVTAAVDVGDESDEDESDDSDSDETVRHYTREEKGKGKARSISPTPASADRPTTPSERVSYFLDFSDDEFPEGLSEKGKEEEGRPNDVVPEKQKSWNEAELDKGLARGRKDRAARIEAIEENRLSLTMEYSRLEAQVRAMGGMKATGIDVGVVAILMGEMEEVSCCLIF
jgi:hypothetical protein